MTAVYSAISCSKLQGSFSLSNAELGWNLSLKEDHFSVLVGQEFLLMRNNLLVCFRGYSWPLWEGDRGGTQNEGLLPTAPPSAGIGLALGSDKTGWFLRVVGACLGFPLVYLFLLHSQLWSPKSPHLLNPPPTSERVRRYIWWCKRRSTYQQMSESFRAVVHGRI